MINTNSTLRQIRDAIWKATPEGPCIRNVCDLKGPILDLAVAKVAGKKAVIHLVDNPVMAFYECCALNTAGRQYQFIPSILWDQGGPIIARMEMTFAVNDDALCPPELKFTAFTKPLGFGVHGPTHLVAAMRCFVITMVGETIEL